MAVNRGTPVPRAGSLTAEPPCSVHLDEFQTAAARTLNPALSPGERLLDAAAGLAEEGGEVLGTVRKHLYQRRPLDPERLREELGDALWCLAAVATAAGMSLGEVAEANLAKLRRRHPDGFRPFDLRSGDEASDRG